MKETPTIDGLHLRPSREDVLLTAALVIGSHDMYHHLTARSQTDLKALAKNEGRTNRSNNSLRLEFQRTSESPLCSLLLEWPYEISLYTVAVDAETGDEYMTLPATWTRVTLPMVPDVLSLTLLPEVDFCRKVIEFALTLEKSLPQTSVQLLRTKAQIETSKRLDEELLTSVFTHSVTKGKGLRVGKNLTVLVSEPPKGVPQDKTLRVTTEDRKTFDVTLTYNTETSQGSAEIVRVS